MFFSQALAKQPTASHLLFERARPIQNDFLRQRLASAERFQGRESFAGRHRPNPRKLIYVERQRGRRSVGSANNDPSSVGTMEF